MNDKYYRGLAICDKCQFQWTTRARKGRPKAPARCINQLCKSSMTRLVTYWEVDNWMQERLD